MTGDAGANDVDGASGGARRSTRAAVLCSRRSRASSRSPRSRFSLISASCTTAAGLSVGRKDFDKALTTEKTDFDKKTVKKCKAYDEKHGWHP